MKAASITLAIAILFIGFMIFKFHEEVAHELTAIHADLNSQSKPISDVAASQKPINEKLDQIIRMLKAKKAKPKPHLPLKIAPRVP